MSRRIPEGSMGLRMGLSSDREIGSESKLATNNSKIKNFTGEKQEDVKFDYTRLFLYVFEEIFSCNSPQPV